MLFSHASSCGMKLCLAGVQGRAQGFLGHSGVAGLAMLAGPNFRKHQRNQIIKTNQ
jgi:hypothetical protein